MSHFRALVTMLNRVDFGISALLPSIFLALLGTFFSLKFYSVIMALSRFLIEGNFKSDGRHFLELLALSYAFALSRAAANYWSTVSNKSLTLNASNRMRELLVRRVLSFGKQFFDKTSIGHLQHLIQRSAGSVSEQMGNFHRVLSGSFHFSAYVGMMIWISLPLTLFVFFLLLTVGIFSKRILKSVHRTSEEAVPLQNALAHQIAEMITGISAIKTFSSSRREEEKFSEVNRQETKLSLSRVKTMELAKPIQDLAQVTILVLVSAAIYALAHSSTPFPIANVFVFIYLVMAAVGTFNSTLEHVGTFINATTEIQSLNLFFDDDGKVFVPSGNHVFHGLQNAIEFRNVRFSYSPDVPILNGATFIVEKKHTTALVGPTGEGKTTLISLLMRFYDCPPRTILIDGMDIRDFSIPSLLSKIAYVPQDIFLFNDTLRNNLLYGTNREVTTDELQSTLEKCCLVDLVTNLPRGLETTIGPRGVSLSGGEKQRIAIARALLRRSEILILDEATSALDVITERKIYEAIDALSGQRTILVLAHRLSTLLHADKIVVIQGGTAVEEGSLDQLVSAQGLFHQYWQSSSLNASPC